MHASISWILLSVALTTKPSDFVDLHTVDSTIKQSIRYASSKNFTGDRISGYTSPKCQLTRTAALALKKVQTELVEFGHSLLVYDCYRPQSSVNHFVKWASTNDEKTKTQYYPAENKVDLFRKGYIAKKSGHSKGSTVDVTIVPIEYNVIEKTDAIKDCRFVPESGVYDDSIPMGTTFDCFDTNSSTTNKNISNVALRNRMLLKTNMEKHGFKNYSKEWWHFALKDEPYPATWFDFPID